MTIKAKFIPQEGLRDLLESYQHRILSLEIELRQMGRDGTLGSGAYKKRVQVLRRLKDGARKLHRELQSDAYSQSASAARYAEELPPAHACTPAEEQLCWRYLAQSEKTLRALCRDCDDVTRWVQRVLRGRMLPLLTTFDLSRLRAKLLRREEQIGSLTEDQKQGADFIASILKASSPLTAERRKKPLPQLKRLFYQLDELSSEIMSLRLRLEKEEEEINWMEHWLSFQELRFSPGHRRLPR